MTQLNIDIQVDEEDGAIYIKIDGFPYLIDSVNYANYLMEYLPSILSPPTLATVH
jgi:hypothetical protein